MRTKYLCLEIAFIYSIWYATWAILLYL